MFSIYYKTVGYSHTELLCTISKMIARRSKVYWMLYHQANRFLNTHYSTTVKSLTLLGASVLAEPDFMNDGKRHRSGNLR